MVYIDLAALVYSALQELEKRVITVAWTMGGQAGRSRARWGLAAGLLVGLGACRVPPPPSPAPAAVRLTRVHAYRSAGAEVVTTARAKVVRLDPETGIARLDTARLTFPASGMTLRAPSATVDLKRDVARGTEGVRVAGPAWHLTGERFDLGPEPMGLVVEGGVDAHGEVAK